MTNKEVARATMERSLEILVGAYSRGDDAVVFHCGEVGVMLAWLHEDETWHFRWIDRIVDYSKIIVLE